jgi:N-sulfoglucosamine sulfohydrolase
MKLAGKMRLLKRLRLSAAPLLLAGTVVGIGAPAQAQSQRPDIVLFIADDMSREDVGIYGSPDARTPNIDKLAREGTRFSNAFASSPTCSPSRSSILTGDYPARHGAHANHSAVRDGITTLPAYLQKLGYRVVIAGKTDFGERSNFPFEYMPSSVIRPLEGKGALWSQLDTGAVDKLLATRDKHKPLALIVASFASHVPWPDNQGYDAGKLTVPPYLLDTPETRQARTMYLTKVTQADTELGAVRASIAKYGMAKNTLLMFTADQGAQFPFAKWNLYDAGIATPLIAVWSGHVPANRTTPAMVSLVDMLPTMQDAAGGTPAKDIDGQSFLPALLGKTDNGHAEIYAAHSGVLDTGPKANIAPMRAIRTSQYKLIVNFRPDINYENAISTGGGREKTFWQSWVKLAETDPRARAAVEHFHHREPVELYDIRKDPYELHNLAGDPAYKAAVAGLRAKLEKWMVAQGEDPAHVPLPSEARPGHFSLCPGTRRQG